MYWMVGWLPGGSAGTSFCNGTDMSISFRAIAFAPWWLLSGLDVEQFRRGAPKDVGLFVIAQRCRRKNVVDRLQLPWIGIIAPDHKLRCADLRDQMPDRLGRKDERIEIDLFEIFARLLLQLDVGIAIDRTDQAGVIRTIRVGGQVAATMRGDHLQPGESIERALEDEVRQHDARLCRIADRVGEEAIAGETFLELRQPLRMNEQGHTQFFRLRPDGMEFWVRKFLAVHGGAYCGTLEPLLLHRCFQLLHGEIGRLQRERGEGREPIRL